MQHKIEPNLIIVYRDGVGDSQLEAVSQHELTQVQEAFPAVPVVFSVIQKDISVRYFVQHNETMEWGNPRQGTVINSFQTTRFEEFYLIPADCNLSTVKPVRYLLLNYGLDRNSVPLQEFQALTYSMSFLYPNWTGSVKLPFPTQLAHKLAYLVGEIQSKDPKKEPEINEKINTRYFYL